MVAVVVVSTAAAVVAEGTSAAAVAAISAEAAVGTIALRAGAVLTPAEATEVVGLPRDPFTAIVAEQVRRAAGRTLEIEVPRAIGPLELRPQERTANGIRSVGQTEAPALRQDGVARAIPSRNRIHLVTAGPTVGRLAAHRAPVRVQVLTVPV